MANGTEMRLGQLLRKLGACATARRWARGRTLAAAWEECQRPDWMLWLASRMAGDPGWPTVQEVVLAAAACAETALPFAGRLRPVCEDALATARRWARGEATPGELRAGAAAADAAYAAAAAAADAADDAAHAAYTAAAYAADAADGAASTAAACAADDYDAANAAAYAAAAAGHDADEANEAMADICRRMLRVPEA